VLMMRFWRMLHTNTCMEVYSEPGLTLDNIFFRISAFSDHSLMQHESKHFHPFDQTGPGWQWCRQSFLWPSTCSRDESAVIG